MRSKNTMPRSLAGTMILALAMGCGNNNPIDPPTGVDESYVHGRAVVTGGRLVGVELPSLIERHNAAAARLVG